MNGGWEEELDKTGSEYVKCETWWENLKVGFGEDVGSTAEIFSAICRPLFFAPFLLRHVLFAALGCCLPTREL